MVSALSWTALSFRGREIDALVAKAWDLDADDLETIFADFTLDAVPEDYREFVRRRFGEL